MKKAQQRRLAKLAFGSCFFVLAGLFILGAPGTAKGRSLEIVQVNIEAEVLPDGSLKVAESRTVDFSGYFSGMYQQIDFFNISLFSKILVREEDNHYTLVNDYPTYQPGTYAIKVFGDEYFTVDWSFEAQDETRTFTLEYIAFDCVVAHNDVAELYYKFIGDRWDYPAGSVFVCLKLPEGAGADEVRAWGHGPLHGEISLLSPQEITWQVAPLKANTFLEGRVIFPLKLVPGAANFSGKEALPAILEEEETWAAEANRLRQARRVQPFVAAALMVLMAWGLFSLWRKALQRKEAFRGDYYRELPGDYSPAAAGYLWYKKQVKPDYLSAQILNLARLRFITIEEDAQTKTFLLTEGSSENLLSPSDGLVMKFIFDTVYNYFASKDKKESVDEKGHKKKAVSFEQIKTFSAKSSQKFYSFYNSWEAYCRQEGREQVFYVEGKSFLVAGFLLFVLSFVLAVVVMVQWALYLLGAALILLPVIFLLASPKTFYTAYGADQLMKWRAFRKFLLHFSAMERSAVPALIIWEHYLVYAVVLGVAKQVIEQLAIVFPRPEADPTFSQTSWYNYGAAHNLAALNTIKTMNRATGALSSTINTAKRASFSSVAAARASSRPGFSSSGSGFSGGGGGGSGGGGGFR